VEERKRTDPPKKTRVRIEDTTIEAAQEILKDLTACFCSRDELSGWFGSMDKYPGGRDSALAGHRAATRSPRRPVPVGVSPSA
jgi:hypothetical protein